MRYLIQGNESKERLEILFKLCSRLGENSKDALIDHLHKGHAEELAATMNGLSKSNFSRAINRLNEVAGMVEDIKEMDWAKFKNRKQTRKRIKKVIA